jgi:hypothetical protein
MIAATERRELRGVHHSQDLQRDYTKLTYEFNHLLPRVQDRKRGQGADRRESQTKKEGDAIKLKIGHYELGCRKINGILCTRSD